MKQKIHSVLFDLDGTLLDTVYDLVAALNRLRNEQQLSALTANEIRPYVSLGSRAMVSFALHLPLDHPQLMVYRAKFLDYYDENIATHTQLFAGMHQVINHLNAQRIPWGIVTNKLTAQTKRLLNATNLLQGNGCVVCGDTLAVCKPDPAPLLHACDLLNVLPEHCLYVGDAQTDIAAAKAAGTYSMAALYGYIDPQIDPLEWQAHHYIEQPTQILAVLDSSLA